MSSPWLRDAKNAFVKQVPVMENSDLMVKDLINEVRGTWRCEVIYYIFHTTDALAIKSIPLTDLNKEDRAIRRLCIDGLLTVRSA